MKRMDDHHRVERYFYMIEIVLIIGQLVIVVGASAIVVVGLSALFFYFK